MPSHIKKIVYNKGIKGSNKRIYPENLLEKEELGIIAIFTAIVIVALLITYVI